MILYKKFETKQEALEFAKQMRKEGRYICLDIENEKYIVIYKPE